MDNSFKFKAEFIIMTLGDKPEDNFRKVAEKGIQVFIVENGDRNYGLYSETLNISEQSIESAIKEALFKLGNNNIYTEILNIRDEIISNEHIIKFTVLAIIRKGYSEFYRASNNLNIRGCWVWVEEGVQSGLIDTKVVLKNKINNPTITLNALHSDGIEKIAKAIKRIRADLYFSDILFQFMPENFTLKEFEESFNTLNGKEVTNIKKKWAYKFVDTGATSEGLAHRPAKIYRLNKFQ